jgi:hypothetical protein
LSRNGAADSPDFAVNLPPHFNQATKDITMTTAGTQAANAELMMQIFRNLQAAEDGTSKTINRFLTMQNHAEEQRQLDRQRAHNMRTNAAQLVADSFAVEDASEQAYRAAMREAQDVLMQVGTESKESAEQISAMTNSVRAIPINTSRRKLQSVSQDAS